MSTKVKRPTRIKEVEAIDESLILEKEVDEVPIQEEVVEEVKTPDVVEVAETMIKKKEVNKQKPLASELPPHVLVDEVVEKSPTKKVKNISVGTVVNCIALRIREGASLKSRIIHDIVAGSKVKIHNENSTESFYSVTYTGETHEINGFCLKEFIEVENDLKNSKKGK